VACAFLELYGNPDKRNTLICDKESALNRAAEFCRRILPAAHHNDLLLLLRNLKPLLTKFFMLTNQKSGKTSPWRSS
jgi:hypothetical protein